MKFFNCDETMQGFEFNAPTQVKFYVNESGPLGGIAYGDKIICGCCGGIFEFDDCISIETLEWVNISEEILGDEAF